MPFLLTLFLLVILPTPLFAAHGVSIAGDLRYPADFHQFAYTSSEARKGGRLVLHDIGSFDKLNPFTLKGEPPLAMASLVFEPLAVASLDEPFSQYGLLAEAIEIAPDQRSVLFTLNPLARFSDGQPVRAEDVGYSLDLFKSDQVHPHFNYYYQDIEGYDVVDEHRIRFRFTRVNRELHLIAAQLPVLPKHQHSQNGFAGSGLLPPVASGPYLVAEINPGKSITYRRNPDYWAIDHPTRRNMYNFDEIIVKYYKDQTIALEAFKAGEFDFIAISIAKQWARDMEGKRFTDGSIVKKSFPHHNNAGMQGFVMNTRNELFQDRRVRQALGMALDFEWINSALFHDQYTRNNSFFSNSPLAASGLPEGLELQYLEPFRKALPVEVFTTPPTPVRTDGPQGLRSNLITARDLLAAAGWQVRDGVLVNALGQPFRFEILLVSPAFERVMASYVQNLRRLGIQAEYRSIDTALYIDRVKKFDFDMIVTTYGQSQSPGNEQRNYWHSSAAKRPGSNNYAGIASEVVDALVDKIIYATSTEELTAACRALDRVLWYGYYLVPNWYLAVHRISYHNKFSTPSDLPLYYQPFDLLMTWWQRR